jgi:hypothetical protein
MFPFSSLSLSLSPIYFYIISRCILFPLTEVRVEAERSEERNREREKRTSVNSLNVFKETEEMMLLRREHA